MADILESFYNACNPLKPADASQYVDADDVRGSRDLSDLFSRELRLIKGDFLTFLFTGHLGCGKSSELHHLAEQLKNPPEGDRYFPIIMDAEEFIDSYDVTPTDVLLSILARFAEEVAFIGIKLSDSYLKRRLKEFKDLLFRRVEVSEEINAETSAELAKISGGLRLLKADPTNRARVREVLGRDISSLKEEIKLQFEKARGQLSKAKGPNGERYKDFVLILDNLEKIERVQGQAEGYQSHRRFFIDGASQLMGLGVHVVYTIPLPLVIHDGGELASLFGYRPFVLPMIKTEERPPKHAPYKAGREKLRTLLQKRAGETPLEDLIAPDALEYLINCCGGHTRQLITFMRSAISRTDQSPIQLREAYDAIADTVALYSRIPQRYWPMLAALEMSPDQMIDQDNVDVKAMLQQLIVLEYRNGGVEKDNLGPAIPWYAVHPIVRRLPMFKRVLNELKPKRVSRGRNVQAKTKESKTKS